MCFQPVSTRPSKARSSTPSMRNNQLLRNITCRSFLTSNWHLQQEPTFPWTEPGFHPSCSSFAFRARGALRVPFLAHISQLLMCYLSVCMKRSWYQYINMFQLPSQKHLMVIKPPRLRVTRCSVLFSFSRWEQDRNPMHSVIWDQRKLVRV